MMVKKDTRNIIEAFYLIVKEISKQSTEYSDFSGLGLVLYKESAPEENLITDLRPSIECPKDIRLEDEEKTIEFLLNISSRYHKLHDGFHFFNQEGLLTHVSQCFFPPIIKNLEVNEKHGTRYHTAMYGSCLDDVILTGVINSGNNFNIFKNGSELKS